jgi:glycosyltransferase involved in cell wall biosynthesis
VSELEKAAKQRKGFGRRALDSALLRAVARLVRALLVRYVRATPRESGRGDPRVTILTVSGWGKGGTTRAMLNLAGYLAGRHEVEIIGVWRTRDEPFFEHPGGVRVHALDDLRPGHEARGLKGLLNRLPSVLVHPADHWATSFSLLTDIRLVRELRRRTGILITTRPSLNLIAAILRPPGLRLVGCEQMHLEAHDPQLREEMRRLYPRLDRFVVLTEGALRDYDAHLDGGVELVRIPNSARELGAPADLDAKVVLAAGRLNVQKGLDWLLAAWARVEPDHEDWNVRICGEGEERAALEAQVARHGLKRVELPGACSDMAREMSRASIFALSSRFEGFPLVLCEAMSKGMAPVSFDCPTGPAEMIEDERNGLIVPLGDVEAFAAALARMIEDDELRHRCGAAAAETGRNFKMDVIGPMWDELFRELPAAPRGAGT